MMAEEYGTGLRIVFAAVVAFTGKRTSDGRVIVAPEGFHCPTRALPLPVVGWIDAAGGYLARVQVGRINEAYVIDGRIIVFGHLETTPEAKPFVDQLITGTHVLEIDLVDVQAEIMNQPVSEDEFLGASADCHLVSWSLAAAHIGDRPSWDLPRVQVEELTR
jgi:hypothetical protein